jgi:hypothetical protein
MYDLNKLTDGDKRILDAFLLEGKCLMSIY